MKYINNDPTQGINYDWKKIMNSETVSETVSDVIYLDTDSIYVRNYDKHKSIIELFNLFNLWRMQNHEIY